MHSTKLMLGLAAAAAVMTALPAAAHADATKSGTCEGFAQGTLTIGPNWSMSGSELTAGEVLHLTSNESDARTGFITFKIEYADETIETTLPFGGTAQLTATQSGSAAVFITTSDAGNENVTTACDAAPDTDGDTIADADDNCPTVANTDQLDTDTNTVGDACHASLPGTGAASDAMVWLAAGLAVVGTGAVFAAKRRSLV